MNTWNIAAKGLLERRTMTALALIGLILGVATIVTLVSVSTGIQNLVQERTSQNKGITILQKDSMMGPVTSQIKMSDLDKIADMPGIRTVCPRVLHLARSIDNQYKVAGQDLNLMADTVIGLIPEREDRKHSGPLTSMGSIVRGRFLTSSDSKAVVIGIEFADVHNKVVGSSVEIDGTKFRVIGIYETGTKQTDQQVLMTLEDAQKLEGLESDTVRMAFVEVENPDKIDQMATRINAISTRIEATSTTQFAELLGGLISNVNYFLWAISAIAAIVAGVNIANTMLMSILEREHELGVMRAIGWTESDVVKLILAESVLLGLVGGIVGLGVGVISVEIIKGLIDVPMLVDANLAFQACAFAVTVGTIGGIYPAWRASEMDPLQALRGE